MTAREDVLARIKEKLGPKMVNFHEKSAKRVYVEVKPEDLPEISAFVFRDLKARFQIATATDEIAAIDILYHWAFDFAGVVVSIRVKLNRQTPEIESIASICTGTEWIEREMSELLGIKFRNHPDMRHLLLADDWPKDNYPLRRDAGKNG